MTDLDLEAIKSRIEKASAGPWTAAVDGLVWAPRLGDPVSASTEPADAEFIAAARTDVPLLVAEVERLQRLLGADLVEVQPRFSSSTAYENAMGALTDERATTKQLLDVLADVLRHFPRCDDPDLRDSTRSSLVPEVTVAHWRRIAGIGHE